jgi:hypothetical protein
MLSEREVNEIYYLSYCSFVDQRQDQNINMSLNGGECNALTWNKRLLGAARHAASVKALIGFDRGYIWNYNFIKGYNFSSSRGEPQTHTIESNKSWLMRFNDTNDGWMFDGNFENKNQLEYCILNNQKLAALDFIHDKIHSYRKDFNYDLQGQQTVYIRKYIEAKRILDNGIEYDDTLEFPFVSGYANHIGGTLREAAKAIVFKYESESANIAESENLRLKFVDIIRKENDIKNLTTILNDFATEHYFYGGSL